MPRNLRFLKSAGTIFILVLVILPLIWISIWFKEGKMFAGGEEGLPFYNLERMARLSKYTWLEVGSGLVEPSVLPRFTTYQLLALLKDVGLNYVQMQKIFFLILLETSILSFYFLGLELFAKEKEKYLVAFVAAIFYISNPFSMGSVWGRFLFTLLELQAVIPLFLLLFIKGLEKGRYSMAFLAGVSTLAFSYIFAAPAAVFVIWTPVLMYFLFSVVSKGNLSKKLRFLLMTGLFWFLLHSWWLLPFLKTYNTAYKQALDVVSNLASAEGVSRVNQLDAIVRLINKSYFFTMEVWGKIYKSVLFQVISYLLPLFAILGAYISRRVKAVQYLILLLFLGLFISNGPNFPLGWLFSFIFKTVPFFSSLRNPFEKMGIVVSLSISLLAAYATVYMTRKFSGVIRLTLISLVILLVSVYSWPMWTGNVIGGKFPAKTLIPNYYDEANEFLNKEVGDSKILILPIVPGNGITYDWPAGIYSGIEPSFNLFPEYSIGQGLNLVVTKDLAKSYHNANKEELVLLSKQVGAGYVVLRNDIDWEKSGTRNPAEILETMVESNSYEKMAEFGKLEVWRLIAFDKQPLFKIIKSQNKEEDFVAVNYQKLDPTHYELEINNLDSSFLSFNQTYDPNWQAVVNGRVMQNKTSNNLSNLFEIPGGNFKIAVMYKVEEYKRFGIKLGGIGIMLGMLLILIERKNFFYGIKN